MRHKDGVLLSLGDAVVARYTLGPYAVNAYEVVCRTTQKSLLIDAPEGIAAVGFQGNPEAVALTHGHGDHTAGLADLLQKRPLSLLAHALDAPRLPVGPDDFLEEGRPVTAGALTLSVFHTPGHTPGSVCMLFSHVLFAGDTLFPNGPGHTDSPAAFRQILDSLERKIFTLSDAVLVFPGHGPPTNVGYERAAYQAFRARGYPENLCGDVVWNP
jgi:glyoxylase-like metal-dependent hydrolase (beta-lactamase superfamily II)